MSFAAFVLDAFDFFCELICWSVPTTNDYSFVLCSSRYGCSLLLLKACCVQCGKGNDSCCIRPPDNRSVCCCALPQGHITEKDLKVFARNSGLPTCYVNLFVSAVLENHGVQYDEELGNEVSYEAFKTFVHSREEALHRAFDLFDKDKEGKISLENLDRSLAHVAVCDPSTRCIYRTQRECVEKAIVKSCLDLQGRCIR